VDRQKDLSALSMGLNAAWRRALDREQWRRTMETAMLQQGLALDDDDDDK